MMSLEDMVLELTNKDVSLPGFGYPHMLIMIMLTKKIYKEATKTLYTFDVMSLEDMEMGFMRKVVSLPCS